MTTYDEVYSLFVTNCYTESLMMPQTIEQQHNAIHNAVLLFNNRLRDSLAYDNIAELFGRILNGDEQLILAHYIRLTVLKNTLTYKNSIFATFTKEIGVRNIDAQIRSLRDEIATEENAINQLIFNMDEESIM